MTRQTLFLRLERTVEGDKILEIEHMFNLSSARKSNWPVQDLLLWEVIKMEQKLDEKTP